MHSYYATAELLATVLEEAALRQDERITRLRINLSPDAHCNSDLIRYYFSQLAANTAAADAQLIFEIASAPEPVQLLEIDITMPSDPKAEAEER